MVQKQFVPMVFGPKVVEETTKEARMVQDVLRSYHEELVEKMRGLHDVLNPHHYHPEFFKTLREIEAAFAACRDQIRTPHQPLEGQPIETK